MISDDVCRGAAQIYEHCSIYSNPFPNRNDSMKRQLTRRLGPFVCKYNCVFCMFQGVKSGLKLIHQIIKQQHKYAKMLVVPAIGPSVPSRASRCPSIDFFCIS